MKIDKIRSALKVKGIANYIENKQARKTTLFSIQPNGSFYFHEGKRIEVKEFNNLHPVTLESAMYKGDNPDGTKIK